MDSHYFTEVLFPSAVDDAFKVLVNMQKSLNKYKLKENANPNWVEDREQALATLVHCINTAKQCNRILQSEYKEAFREGWLKGKKDTERRITREQEFSAYDPFNVKNKEKLRASTILNAQRKWNF